MTTITPDNTNIREYVTSILRDPRLKIEDKIDNIVLFYNNLKSTYNIQNNYNNRVEKLELSKHKLNDDYNSCCYCCCLIPRICFKFSKVIFWIIILFIFITCFLYIFLKTLKIFR